MNLPGALAPSCPEPILSLGLPSRFAHRDGPLGTKGKPGEVTGVRVSMVDHGKVIVVPC